MFDFYNESRPVARKDHWCELCRSVIPKGTKYKYEAGKYDGDFFERRYHFDCEKIRDIYIQGSDDNEFQYDWILDWWRDNYCECCVHYDENRDCDLPREKEMSRTCYCMNWKCDTTGATTADLLKDK